ncbi:MAG: glycosyltransferase family 39 protein [Anaerolineae bacterium]
MTEDATHQRSNIQGKEYIALAAAMIAVVGLAAWWRWQYLVHVQPYPDEFVTLLAVRTILERGLPILPSGLFYEHGLFFSYLGAAASALAGFSREAVRAASVLASLVSVLLAWYWGRRHLGTLTGLMAAAVLACAPDSILWGGRARMYSLLLVWVLLASDAALSGAVQYSRRWRSLAAVVLLAAALTHFVALALVVPLVSGIGLLLWRQTRHKGLRALLPELPIWVGVALVALLVKRLGQPNSVAPLEGTASGILGGVVQVLTIYAAWPEDVTAGWPAAAAFFVAPENIWLSILAAISIVGALHNRLHSTAAERDTAALFLAWLIGVSVLEMGVLVAPQRRDDRYYFMLLPLLALLAADGLVRLAGVLTRMLKREVLLRRAGTPAAMAACVVIAGGYWPVDAALVARRGNDYDAAFAYVRANWQADDAVLTGTPAAAVFYLGRNDYYAMQGIGYAYRLMDKAGDIVDRWVGSPWLGTDEQLHAVLSGPRRVWLVLERWGLTVEYFTPLTMQRLLAMTDFVREENGIIILRSRPGARLIPEYPSRPLNVQFADLITLQGYDVALLVGGSTRTLELVLYWQAQRPLDYDYTVFVHLRDPLGRTVAQADHVPLAPVYPPTLWPSGHIIRERSVLRLPQEMSLDAYALWVGLYRLDTLERLPVVGDTSGENAVSLRLEGIW